MRIICAWCDGEGKSGVIGEKGPSTDLRETHGICQEHVAWLRATSGVARQQTISQNSNMYLLAVKSSLKRNLFSLVGFLLWIFRDSLLDRKNWDRVLSRN